VCVCVPVDVCMCVCVSWTIRTCTKIHVHGTHKSQTHKYARLHDDDGVGRWRHRNGATSPHSTAAADECIDFFCLIKRSGNVAAAAAMQRCQSLKNRRQNRNLYFTGGSPSAHRPPHQSSPFSYGKSISFVLIT